MQIDYALILSAGLGTRMGEIGKVLPKVMWPILNKRLIDLQINYCRELGIKKIFINTHFLSNVIESHIAKNYPEVIILHEDPILDSGGAIHNLATQAGVNYRGNLLTINGDQFYLFDKKYFNEALSFLADCRAVLFGIEVNKNSSYNETVLHDGFLTDIAKNNQDRDYVTFSGIGLIKLDGLKKVEGPSKFFQTVAPFKSEKVKMITPTNVEYWDFGTASIYFDSLSKIKEKINNENSFIKFLERCNVDLSSIKNYFNAELKSIDLDGQNGFHENSIRFKEIVMRLN
jgi:mannose-1-phosphate guanylyltransferase